MGSLLDELRRFTGTWRSDYELLLVDDGSTDRTAEIIGNQFTDWRQGRLIQLSQNCGQAAALFHGMKCARGQVVILLDGDGQNDPQDIPKILAPLNEVDMVVGIRVERRDSLFAGRCRGLLMQREAESWETASSIADAGSRRFIEVSSTRLSRCERSILLSRRWRSAQDLRFAKCRCDIAPEAAENQNMGSGNFYGSRCLTWPGSGGSPGGDVRW